MKTKNSAPSSTFEEKDRCPSCGAYCNIHIDLDKNDECNDCRFILVKESKQVNMKQTAVEWLVEQVLNNKGARVISTSTFYIKDEIVNQAKEMEKQQIIDAYQSGNISMMSAEQYYNEKFKNK